MNLQPAIDLIQSFEGCRLSVYLDPVGLPTVGWGQRTDLPLGTMISQQQADNLLFTQVANVANFVTLAIGSAQLSNNQVCALIDFAYNAGTGAFQGSTILRDIQSGILGDVTNQLSRWTHADGQVLPGLISRRQAEINLWNTPDV